MALPNVIDPVWRLCEETGRLGYDSFRVVSRKPRHLVLVAKGDGEVPQELADRYWRILEDKKDRGIP